MLWALGDCVVTGDALHSLHGTARAGGEATAARTSLTARTGPPKYFGSTLRVPLLLGIPIGLVFAWRARRRRALLPFVVAVAMPARCFPPARCSGCR